MGIDRLSSLSDEIILHILSFLDAKHAVQTSLLSKKYTTFWTSLPNPNFDSTQFKRLSHFQTFFRRFITLHNPNTKLHSFTFYCIPKSDTPPHFYESAIDYATSRSATRLHVSSQSHEGYYCKKFRVVRLPNLPTVLRLRQLTHLRLENFVLCNQDVFKDCPSLVELILVNAESENPGRLSICGDKLIKLVLWNKEIWRNQSEASVVAPKLKSFTFGGCPGLITFSGKNEVETLNIDACYEDGEKEKIAKEVIDLMQVFSSAKWVALSIPTVELLSVLPLSRAPQPFSNIKYLKMVTGKNWQTCLSLNVSVEVVNYFLRSSPDLKVSMEFARCSRIGLLFT